MPALASHKAAANRFLSLYEKIPGDYPEGKALMLFYSALHLVEAVAASDGVHHRTHQQRRAFIESKYRDMWKHFRPLVEAAERARYLPDGFAMNSEQVEHQLRRKCYRAIECWAAKIFGEEEPPLIETISQRKPPVGKGVVSGKTASEGKPAI